jgi:hypothetical protein
MPLEAYISFWTEKQKWRIKFFNAGKEKMDILKQT